MFKENYLNIIGKRNERRNNKIMKAKFKFIFRDGTTMRDRNSYRTIAQARAWAKAHNKYTQRKTRKVLRVVPIK